MIGARSRASEPCSAPGCTRPVGTKGAHGYCQAHYRAWRNGRPLVPIASSVDRQALWRSLAEAALQYADAETEADFQSAYQALRKAALEYALGITREAA